VNVAGAWADRIASMVGLDLAMTTWSHDVMFLRRPQTMGQVLFYYVMSLTVL
jgi:glycine/D-amino acid oxidase-like deaminating enzyme